MNMNPYLINIHTYKKEIIIIFMFQIDITLSSLNFGTTFLAIGLDKDRF